MSKHMKRLNNSLNPVTVEEIDYAQVMREQNQATRLYNGNFCGEWRGFDVAVASTAVAEPGTIFLGQPCLTKVSHYDRVNRDTESFH